MATPPPKTIIITGISPHSPLSTHIATHLLSQSTTTPSQPVSLAIALLGPSLLHLTQTATYLLSLPSPIPVSILPFELDIKSAQSIGITAHSIRAQLGAADIVIHNASAHLPYPSAASPGSLAPIRGADEDDWWEVFEVNVRSIHSVARHFFTKMREGARFVNVVPQVGGAADGGINGETGSRGLEKGMAVWDASAVAAERAVKYLATENPHFECFSVRVRQDGGLNEEEWREGAGRVVDLLGS